VGGLILEWYWWGAAFLIAVPIVGVLLILGPFLLPEYRAPHRARLDLPSMALSLGAMLPIVYGIKLIAKSGYAHQAAVAVLLGVLCGWVFVRRQRRLADSWLDLGLFANRRFCVALPVLGWWLVSVRGAVFW